MRIPRPWSVGRPSPGGRVLTELCWLFFFLGLCGNDPPWKAFTWQFVQLVVCPWNSLSSAIQLQQRENHWVSKRLECPKKWNLQASVSQTSEANRKVLKEQRMLGSKCIGMETIWILFFGHTCSKLSVCCVRAWFGQVAMQGVKNCCVF